MIVHLWLEPLGPATDLDEGLRARTADPVWFLTRQWQLGEHQGEDASSPVVVALDVTHESIVYDVRRPELDPCVVPAEALVEAEPGDWWTIGRRVRLGRAAASHLASVPEDKRAMFRFAKLPAPYAHLSGELDGRAIFRAGVLPGHAIWQEVPSPAADRWSARELAYHAPFSAGGQRLAVKDHDGGDVDWFSVDGEPGKSFARSLRATHARRTKVLPSRLDYPGAPHPRWWQIEDKDVDLGGFSPDRSHFGTMLLLDVVLAHADDWFWFTVPTPPPSDSEASPPSAGRVVTLKQVVVTDSFDDPWTLDPPSDNGAGAWSLFRTSGLDRTALVVWPVAVAPHAGAWLDEIHVGIDEDANLAWAIELRADGMPLADDTGSEEALRQTRRTHTRAFRYLPSTTLPAHWHPYRRTGDGGLHGEWQQGIVADLTVAHPRPRPGPHSRMIGGPSGPGAGRGHEIAAYAIPSSGVALRRRAMLARDTEGRPILWVERSARPLSAPPTSHLRFDVLAEDAQPAQNQ